VRQGKAIVGEEGSHFGWDSRVHGQRIWYALSGQPTNPEQRRIYRPRQAERRRGRTLPFTALQITYSTSESAAQKQTIPFDGVLIGSNYVFRQGRGKI
jgi:hypothetical protein